MLYLAGSAVQSGNKRAYPQAVSDQPSIFGLFAPQWLDAIVDALRVVEAKPMGLHYLLVDICQMLLGWDQLFPAKTQDLPLEAQEPAEWLLKHLVRSCYG